VNLRKDHSNSLFFSTTNPSLTFAILNLKNLMLSAMDVLGLTTMKDAAICDKQYDLQNSTNHQIFERKLHLLSSET
jgi:hypothetical protein